MQRPSSDLLPVSVSIPVAAKLLGISVRTTWNLVKEDRLQSFRIGSRVLIPYDALHSFVEQRLAAAQGA